MEGYLALIKEQREESDKLQQELDQYKNNWEELKATIKAEKDGEYCGNNDYICGKNDGRKEIIEIVENVLNKMKELEEDK